MLINAAQSPRPSSLRSSPAQGFIESSVTNSRLFQRQSRSDLAGKNRVKRKRDKTATQIESNNAPSVPTPISNRFQVLENASTLDQSEYTEKTKKVQSKRQSHKHMPKRSKEKSILDTIREEPNSPPKKRNCSRMILRSRARNSDIPACSESAPGVENSGGLLAQDGPSGPISPLRKKRRNTRRKNSAQFSDKIIRNEPNNTETLANSRLGELSNDS